MLALVLKLIDFLRYLKAVDVNGIFTQAAVWVSGVLVTFLAARSDWADGIEVGDRALSVLNGWSLVFVGLSIASGASVVKDTLKSVDNANSSVIPTLLPPGPKDGLQAAPQGQTVGDAG